MTRFPPFCRLILLMVLAVLGAVACKDDPPPTPPPVVQYVTPPTASVTGQVSVPDGFERFGVTVFAEGTSFLALSDATGKYTITGLKPGDYTLRASRIDLASIALGTFTVTDDDLKKAQPFKTMLPAIMEARSPDDPSSISLTGNNDGTVRGTIKTEVPGDEVGAIVTLVGTAFRTAAASDGNFEIQNVAKGKYSLLAERAGYKTLRKEIEVVSAKVINVGDVVMEAVGQENADTRMVFGRVEILTGDGSESRAFGAVQVELSSSNLRATPDSSGNFEISDIPPGRYTVTATLDGYLLEAPVDVDLEAIPAAEVSLVLLEDTSEAAGSGTVIGTAVLDPAPDSGFAGITVALAGTSFTAVTDSEGNYRLEKVDPGTYDLVATFAGYETAIFNGLEVVGAVDTDGGELTLTQQVDAPYVIATNPANGARRVPIVNPTRAIIEFSKQMNPDSVIAAISISPEVDYRIIPGGDKFTLEMSAINGRVLRFSTTYKVTIAKSASDREGVPMRENYVYSFTTDDPIVIGSYPEDGATEAYVNFDNPMLIRFNASIDPDTLQVGDFKFDPPLVGSPSMVLRRDAKTGWSVAQLSFYPEPNTRYRVTLNRGAKTILKDRIRNLPYRFTFSSPRLRTFDEVYGNRTNNDDGAVDRERNRRRRSP